MLLVQKFLQNHTFQQLKEMHGVYPSFSKSGHKFSLNYDMIESKENDPLAQECRGLILALEDGRPVFGQQMPDGKFNRDNIEPGPTKIIAFSMKRFFNYGQGSCAEINWNDPNLSILEKLDGSLIILYFDPIVNQWHTATRGCPEADIPLGVAGFTFRTLFEKALKDTIDLSFDDFTSKLDKSITYCFELTSPFNRIVVKYDESRITLLAARSLNSLEELDITKLNVCNIPCVQAHTYTTINDLINFVSSQNPLEHEGVVVRDSNFNRIKVKNVGYIAFNKARDMLGSSDRNCLELIIQEKDDDVIPALPQEIVDNLLNIKSKYIIFLKKYEDLYNQILSEANTILPNDKKTFAITLSKHKGIWQAPFFQIFDGKANSIKDFIQRNRKEGTWSNSFIDKLLEFL